MDKIRKLSFVPWLLASVALTPTITYAQSQPSDEHAARIDDIIVTARKRSENIQNVPLSIAAIGAEEIQRQGVTSLNDVSRLTPGLIFDQGFNATDTRPMIRGMSTARGRPSVSVLVDGVDLTSEGLITGGGFGLLNMRLNDLERVEVVRGPQSTIYGRNAFGGAINYVTARPSDALSWGATAEAGSYGLMDIGGFISGPLTETLSARLNYAHHEMDGYYRNQINGVKAGSELSDGARLQLQYTPNDNLVINLTAEYTKAQDKQRAATLVLANTPLTYPKPTIANPNARSNYGVFIGDVIADESGVRYIGDLMGYKYEVKRGVLDIQYDLGWGSVTSIVSAIQSKGRNMEDGTFGLVPVAPSALTASRAYSDTRSDFEQLSWDLRLASDQDSRLKYLIGMYLFTEDANELDFGQNYFANCAITRLLPTARCAVGPSQLPNREAITEANPVSRETKSAAIYGSIAYEITPNLTVTAEARYTDETVKAQQFVWLNVPLAVQRLGFTAPLGHVYADMFGITGTTVMAAKTTSSYLNPRFTIDYQATPDLLVYANVAKGTKPGGVAQISSTADYNITRYDPEEVWTGEIGVKSSWLDHRLNLNAATYFSRYTDQQVSLQEYAEGQVHSRVQNAGVVEIAGLELDATYRPTHNLTLNAGYSFTHGRYEEFLDSSTMSLAVAPTVIQDTPAGPIAYGDLKGNSMPGVPEHHLTLGAYYEWSLNAFGGSKAYVEGNSTYKSSRYAESDYTNTIQLKSHWMTDFQVGLETDHWRAAAYVRNVFDERVVTNALKYLNLASPTYDEAVIAFLPTPRTFGVRLSYKY